MTYKPLHSDLYDPDTSYSTRLLQRLNQNGQWVQENRGSHTVLTLESSGNSETDTHYERPFTSVSTWSTILRIPWFVHTDIGQITVRAYCRISNGFLDQNFDSAGDQDLPFSGMGFKAAFATDGKKRSSDSYNKFAPKRDTDGEAEWGWIEFTYEPSDDYKERLGLRNDAGSYDSLMVAIQSAPATEQTFQGYVVEGDDMAGYRTAIYAIDADNSERFLIRTDTQDTYEESSSTDAPPPSSNEINASVVTNGSGAITGVYNHIRRQARTQNDGMFIWPDLNVDQRHNEWINVSLYPVPYVQFRAIEIQETYE